MVNNDPQPLILPLSNPTANCEATPEQVITWSKGAALVATGSPFSPVTYEGTTHTIGQCNNVFVFPGVGLGVISSGANKVLPSFFTAAAHAVAQEIPDEALERGELLPSVADLKKVSQAVAYAVGEDAINKGVAEKCSFSTFEHKGDPARLGALLSNMQWQLDYLPIKKVDRRKNKQR